MDYVKNKLITMINNEYNKYPQLFDNYDIITTINENSIIITKPLIKIKIKNSMKTTLSLQVTWKQLNNMLFLEDTMEEMYSIVYNWHSNTYDKMEDVVCAMKYDYNANHKIMNALFL
jgi:hypothetical protein